MARLGGTAMVADAPRHTLAWPVRFAILAGIWGVSFLFIKLGVQVLVPLQVALARLSIGAVTLLSVLRVQGVRLPRGVTVWKHLAITALLGSACPFTLYAFGETHVTSVVASIWNATTPLVTLLIAMVTLPDERPTRDRVLGLGIGFLGVLVVLGVWRGVGGNELIGNAACGLAALGYGISFPYMRKYLTSRAEPLVALATGQVLCGALEVGVVAVILTQAPRTLTVAAVVSMLLLGSLGTGIAYIINYGLMREIGATMTSTVTYVIPIVATIVGVVGLHERLMWNQPVGGAVVLCGVVVSQGRVARWLRRAPPAPTM